MESWWEWFKDPVHVAMAIPIGSIILLIACILPYQAYCRGHGFVSWFLLQLVSLNNPIFLLVLVANLPNKAKMRQRERYAAELDQKLQGLSKVS